MSNLVTVVDVYNKANQLVKTAKTRKELEDFLGFEVWSRNENNQRWKQPDKEGIDSLCAIDEVSVGFDAKMKLHLRFEKV